MAPTRPRSSSPSGPSHKKQKIDIKGDGSALNLPDPTPLAEEYQAAQPYKYISVGGLFDDQVVSASVSSTLDSIYLKVPASGLFAHVLLACARPARRSGF